jgi:hypothetical protein
MKFLICFAFVFATYSNSFSQSYSVGAGGALNNSFDAFSVTEMKYVPKLSGSDYLYSDWLLADVKLRIDSGLIQNILVKMDVTNNVIEVKLPDTIRVAPSILIESIKFKNPLRGSYTTRYALDVLGPVGFYQSIYENEVAIFAHLYTTIAKADYNIVLQTGSKDDVVELKKMYFVKHNGKLFQFELKKSSLLALFKNNQLLENFLKQNKIALKSEEDLKKIGDFLNSNFSALQIIENAEMN